MTGYLDNVAVVGGGLGGCALAVALSGHGIPVTVYEARPANHDIFQSGVVLTPNGLRVLDELGTLPRMHDRCYKTPHRVFKDREDRTIGKTMIADESLYGYSNHRVWRGVLLNEMKKMLTERSVEVRYEARFGGVVSDDSNGVTFLVNNEEHHVSMVFGSDGINSTVRRHIAPGAKPWYTGVTAVLAHIERASVAWPYPEYEANATIQDNPGAIFFVPEDPEEKDIMIGMQVHYPEQSKDDLSKLQADKDKLLEFYTRKYDDWGPTARKIVDQVKKDKDTLFIWPFLRMPALPTWYSESGRVIIVGDGAHALPASSGQGINQALEDVHSLTLLLRAVLGKQEPMNGFGPHANGETSSHLLEALAFWQQMRQQRVDAVFDYATNATNVQRLPEADRQKLIAEGKATKAGDKEDMSWLYKPELEGKVNSWVEVKANTR